MGHRNLHHDIGRIDRLAGEPLALGAEDDRDACVSIRRHSSSELTQIDGSWLERQRGKGEAVLGEGGSR